MNTSDFNFVFLGQSVLRYKVPSQILYTINDIYEKRRHELYPANKQLVGKIKNEHSLFFDGPPNNKMQSHRHLPHDVMQWFFQKTFLQSTTPSLKKEKRRRGIMAHFALSALLFAMEMEKSVSPCVQKCLF